MYKVSNDLSSPFMKHRMADLCVPCNTRSTSKDEKKKRFWKQVSEKSDNQLPPIKTVTYELESIRYAGLNILESVLNVLEELTSL